MASPASGQTPEPQPSTDWREEIADGEAERFEAHAQELLQLQRRNARGGRPSRALHAKGMPGVEAVFTVHADLPAIARVGLFSRPGSYRTFVRFSNGSGARQDDRKPDIRGVALKLMGVTGRKLIPGMEDALTQDFLLIRTPATPVRDADEFMALVRASTSPVTGLPRLLRQLGPLRLVTLLARAMRSLAPIDSLATTSFYSALPIRFGDHAVHYALRPHTLREAGDCRGSGPDYLAQDLAVRLRNGPVSYDFQIQFYTDPVNTPIEDASVEWKESHSPFVTVGHLSLLQQDVASPAARRLSEFIETLSFDPWQALTMFRPLGNMMRARNVAYRVSTQAREAAPEPNGDELLG